MGETRIHMAASVRGMLNWNRRHTKRMLRTVRKADGSRFASVDEFRFFLMAELAAGRDVIPPEECDNWDWEKGCLGHPVAASEIQQEVRE